MFCVICGYFSSIGNHPNCQKIQEANNKATTLAKQRQKIAADIDRETLQALSSLFLGSPNEQASPILPTHGVDIWTKGCISSHSPEGTCYKSHSNLRNISVAQPNPDRLGFGGGGFGSGCGAAQQQQVNGTRTVPYQITTERNSNHSDSSGNYVTITAMPQYSSKCIEELRVEDYANNDRGCLFGAQSVPATGFGTHLYVPHTSDNATKIGSSGISALDRGDRGGNIEAALKTHNRARDLVKRRQERVSEIDEKTLQSFIVLFSESTMGLNGDDTPKSRPFARSSVPSTASVPPSPTAAPVVEKPTNTESHPAERAGGPLGPAVVGAESLLNSPQSTSGLLFANTAQSTPTSNIGESYTGFAPSSAESLANKPQVKSGVIIGNIAHSTSDPSRGVIFGASVPHGTSPTPSAVTESQSGNCGLTGSVQNSGDEPTSAGLLGDTGRSAREVSGGAALGANVATETSPSP